MERYGHRLVCVRYRHDRERRTTIETVELIEDESPWTPGGCAIYLAKIGYEEAALREKVKTVGGPWKLGEESLVVTGANSPQVTARSRVVAWLEPQ